MASKRSSDLYQVDFVAALFGGFMLIWLANASEAEFAAEPTNQPVFFELSGRLHYPVNGGGKWVSVLPQSALDRGCVHPEVVTIMEGEKLGIRPCRAGLIEKLRAAQTHAGFLDTVLSAMDASEPGSSNRAANILISYGVQMSVVDRALQPPIVGLAIASVSETDQEDSLWKELSLENKADIRNVLVAIGVIAEPNRLPDTISFKMPATFTGAVFAVPTDGTASQSTVAVTPYYFNDLNERLLLRNNRPDHLEVTLRIDPAATNACYSGMSENIFSNAPIMLRLVKC